MSPSSPRATYKASTDSAASSALNSSPASFSTPAFVHIPKTASTSCPSIASGRPLRSFSLSLVEWADQLDKGREPRHREVELSIDPKDRREPCARLEYVVFTRADPGILALGEAVIPAADDIQLLGDRRTPQIGLQQQHPRTHPRRRTSQMTRDRRLPITRSLTDRHHTQLGVFKEVQERERETRGTVRRGADRGTSASWMRDARSSMSTLAWVFAMPGVHDAWRMSCRSASWW